MMSACCLGVSLSQIAFERSWVGRVAASAGRMGSGDHAPPASMICWAVQGLVVAKRWGSMFREGRPQLIPMEKTIAPARMSALRVNRCRVGTDIGLVYRNLLCAKRREQRHSDGRGSGLRNLD
jgi:hypothetical protein